MPNPTLLLLLLSTLSGIDCRDQRWVWGYNNYYILPSDLIIPGGINDNIQYHQPQPSSTVPNTRGDSTRITTFHPSLQYLLENTNIKIPHQSNDGGQTTKSRVVEDTLSTVSSDKDRYTTLDKLFQERGDYKPQREAIHAKHLGGLEPEEVFYADDDLLIIKGGGFPVDLSEDKLQPLDDLSDPADNQPPQVQNYRTLSPPSPDEEYNGNIPVIVPPPSRHYPTNQYKPSYQGNAHYIWGHENHVNSKRSSGTNPQPVYVPRQHNTGTIIYPANMQLIPVIPQQQHQIPVISQQQQQQQHNPVYNYNPSLKPSYIKPATVYQYHYQPHQYKAQSTSGHHQQQLHRVKQKPISLHRDTDVNFLHPRPPINQHAEIISQQYEDFGNNVHFQVKQTQHPKPRV